MAQVKERGGAGEERKETLADSVNGEISMNETNF